MSSTLSKPISTAPTITPKARKARARGKGTGRVTLQREKRADCSTRPPASLVLDNSVTLNVDQLAIPAIRLPVTRSL